MDLVLFTPLQLIPTMNGDVRHAMKASDPGFTGFGEAYFSTVAGGAVKGWKRHRAMTLNLIVPCGEMRFAIHREETGDTQHVQLTPDRPHAYGRLTIAPGLWVAFGGVGAGLNMLLNLADMAHDPSEADTRPIEAFAWDWSDAR